MRAVMRSKMRRENIFNWDRIIRRDEIVFVPLSWAWNSRSSPPWVFLRKGVLKIYSKFTGEHPSISVILIKLLCNFVEITHQHGCSPVNLLLFLEHLFLRTSLAGCFWNRIIDFIIFIAGKSFEQNCSSKFDTVFPLIKVGSQRSAALLVIHIEIIASL